MFNPHDYQNCMFIACSSGVGSSKLHDVGYNVSAAVEILPERWRLHHDIYGKNDECKTLLFDFAKHIPELVKIYKERQCHGIIFTLPCQPFSLAGGQHLGDYETWLFLSALELCQMIAKEKDAVLDFTFWENAPYFISPNQDKIITDRLNGATILQHITAVMNSLGHDVNADKIDASRYGTAQARVRGIILTQRNKRWEFPAPDEKVLTVRDAIGYGKFKTLESGQRDPDDEFHRIGYINPLQAECIRHTATGCAAIKNPPPYKFVNIDGRLCQGSHTGVAGRNDWDKPAHTIIQGSDSLCGDWTLHPGNLQPDGTYDNARYFSVAEIFALTGIDKRYTDAIPAWARKNDKLLREICGEALLPNLVNRIFSNR